MKISRQFASIYASENGLLEQDVINKIKTGELDGLKDDGEWYVRLKSEIVDHNKTKAERTLLPNIVGGLVASIIFGGLLVAYNLTIKSEEDLKQPSISADCNINGWGEVTCTFNNSGEAEGSMCIKAELVANSIKMASGVKICSGIVKVNDVRQTTQNGNFDKMPAEFCKTNRPSMHWNDNCEVKFVKI